MADYAAITVNTKPNNKAKSSASSSPRSSAATTPCSPRSPIGALIASDSTFANNGMKALVAGKHKPTFEAMKETFGGDAHKTKAFIKAIKKTRQPKAYFCATALRDLLAKAPESVVKEIEAALAFNPAVLAAMTPTARAEAEMAAAAMKKEEDEAAAAAAKQITAAAIAGAIKAEEEAAAAAATAEPAAIVAAAAEPAAAPKAGIPAGRGAAFWAQAQATSAVVMDDGAGGGYAIVEFPPFVQVEDKASGALDVVYSTRHLEKMSYIIMADSTGRRAVVGQMWAFDDEEDEDPTSVVLPAIKKAEKAAAAAAAAKAGEEAAAAAAAAKAGEEAAPAPAPAPAAPARSWASVVADAAAAAPAPAVRRCPAYPAALWPAAPKKAAQLVVAAAAPPAGRPKAGRFRGGRTAPRRAVPVVTVDGWTVVQSKHKKFSRA